MKKIILGFTGEMGCGKDTAQKYIFNKFGGKTFKFSGSLRDILSRIYVEHSRENIALISRVLRENFGQDILAKVLKNDVDFVNENVILIDGVRRKEDLVYLNNLPEFKLVFIESDINNRYKRLSGRGENAGDNEKTFEQFLLDQELETEVTIRGLKEISHHVIHNDGNLEDFYSQIDKILED